MPTIERTLDELAGIGGGIFDRQVRPALRPEDDGKFVAIDVGSGDYEIDEDDYAAVARLRSRKTPSRFSICPTLSRPFLPGPDS